MRTEPVLTYQDERELQRLITIYKQCRPMRVLEVGTAYGGTLYEWLRNAQPGAVVVSVDEQDPRMANTQLWHSWCADTVKLELIKGDSHSDAVQALARKWAPFDFIYIDGDHSLGGVTRDWVDYSAMAKRPGGIIALDDIKPNTVADPPCEVDKLWDIIRKLAQSKGGMALEQIIGDWDGYGNGQGVVYL